MIYHFHANGKRRLRLLVRVIRKTLTLLKHEDMILSCMTQTREKWDSLVLSRADFWMVWTCHGNPCFHFYLICLEQLYKRIIGWKRLPSLLCFFFRKCHCESTWSQLCSKFFINNYEAPWQRHLKDTLQLKILRILGVKPAPRHLTYYLIIASLSLKQV